MDCRKGGHVADQGKYPAPWFHAPCPPMSYSASFRCRQPEQFTWSWSKCNTQVLSLVCFICSCKYSLKDSEFIVSGWKYLEVPRQWRTTCTWPYWSCSILQNSLGVYCLPRAKTCCSRDGIMAGVAPLTTHFLWFFYDDISFRCWSNLISFFSLQHSHFSVTFKLFAYKLKYVKITKSFLN